MLAYPALADAGAAVDVRLFETEAAARSAMWAGTRRLILLGAPSPVKSIAGRLSTPAKLALSHNPHGSVAAMFADCVNCAADYLMAEAGGPARDREGFERLSAAVRSGLHEVTAEVVTHVESALRLAHAVEARLEDTRADAVQPAVADMRAQLSGLIYPGFVTATGYRRLPQLARYLRGIERRLDKLPDSPARDAASMAIAQRAEQAYRQTARRPAPGPPRRPGRGRGPLAARGTPGQPVRPDPGHPRPGVREPDPRRPEPSAPLASPGPGRTAGSSRPGHAHVALLRSSLSGVSSPPLDYIRCYVSSKCDKARRKAGTVTGDPPVRRRLVGGALRRYRENVGYALEDAARVLECDRSKISRIETGQRGIRPKELRELLTEYGVPASEQLALVSIASRGGQHSWWHPYAAALSDAYLDYVIMESAAAEIMTYEAQLIPDLLQTDEYARAIAAAEPGYETDQQRDDAVAAKAMRRQAVLDGRRLSVVLGEGALYQAVGGADVMAGQLSSPGPTGRSGPGRHPPGAAVLGRRARRRGRRIPGHPEVPRRAQPGRRLPGGAVRRRLPREPGRRGPLHPRLRAAACLGPQPRRQPAAAGAPCRLAQPAGQRAWLARAGPGPARGRERGATSVAAG